MKYLIIACLALCGCTHHETAYVPVETQPIVFLGDSITAHSHVSELWPRMDIVDLSFSSLPSAAILARAEANRNLKPRLVVVQCGYNDADSGRGTIEGACRNIDAILEVWPRAVYIVQTMSSIQDGKAPTVSREVVNGINAYIRSLGDRAIVLDVGAAFADDWTLRDRGGLHWTEAGVQKWKGLIGPYVGGTQ